MQKLFITVLSAAILFTAGSTKAAEDGPGGKRPMMVPMEETALQHAQDLNLTADQQTKFKALVDAKKAALDSLSSDQRDKLRQMRMSNAPQDGPKDGVKDAPLPPPVK